MSEEFIDDLYSEAVQVVQDQNRCSVSMIQRHFRIGYNRAARMVEMMEDKKIVSPMNYKGERTVFETGEPAQNSSCEPNKEG